MGKTLFFYWFWKWSGNFLFLNLFNFASSITKGLHFATRMEKNVEKKLVKITAYKRGEKFLGKNSQKGKQVKKKRGYCARLKWEKSQEKGSGCVLGVRYQVGARKWKLLGVQKAKELNLQCRREGTGCGERCYYVGGNVKPRETTLNAIEEPKKTTAIARVPALAPAKKGKRKRKRNTETGTEFLVCIHFNPAKSIREADFLELCIFSFTTTNSHSDNETEKKALEAFTGIDGGNCCFTTSRFQFKSRNPEPRPNHDPTAATGCEAFSTRPSDSADDADDDESDKLRVQLKQRDDELKQRDDKIEKLEMQIAHMHREESNPFDLDISLLMCA